MLKLRSFLVISMLLMAAAASVASAEQATPADRLEAALQEEDYLLRAKKLVDLLVTLGPEAVPAVEAILIGEAKLTDVEFLNAGEVGVLTRFWAQHDARAASDWAIHRSPLAWRVGAMLASVELWAKAEPHKVAEALIEARLKGMGAMPLQIALANGWVASGEPGFAGYVKQLDPMNRQRALGAHARAMILQHGAQAAIDWTEALEDEPPGTKRDAYRQLGSELGLHDPEAAVAWCSEVCDRPDAGGTRPLMVYRWSRVDGRAATEYAAKSTGPERDWTLKEAIRGWWGGDRARLKAWLAEIEATEEIPEWLQPSMMLIATWIGRDGDVEGGLRWAARVDDPADRDRAYVNLYRDWRQRDKPAADAWIESSPLSEEARKRAKGPGSDMGMPAS